MGPAESDAAMIQLLAEGRTEELQQVLAALPEPTPFAEVGTFYVHGGVGNPGEITRAGRS